MAEDPALPTIRPRVPWLGLVAAVGLMVLAMAVPALTGWNVYAHWFPPLDALWRPRVGIGTGPAVLLGALAAWQAVPLAERLGWRRLLLACYVGGVAWLFLLAFVDGPNGIGAVLNGQNEYLNTARATTDLHRTLQEYVSRIPLSAPDHWPVHVAGHPPGALSFFVLLVRIGLGSGFAAGTVVTLLAGSTALAVMVTLRTLGAETTARRAAPFLVFGPAALWQAVSADAMFAAVAAWGVAALALAAVRRRGWSMAGWSVVSGLLLGYCVMLSYGLPILAILAVAVLWVARSWRPLVGSVLAAAAVVLTFAALGFEWWQALPVLHDRYWAGIAAMRPASYWLWGDLAALTFSAGPLLGAGLAMVVRRAGSAVERTLVAAAALMVLAADASLMSKAEVERIWLPFAPWLLISCALLPLRWRRGGLVLQIGFALVLQHLLFTRW